MKKGFTLVELLVVIAIISILTIITVSQFQTARKKGNDVQRKGDLNGLAKALQMYYTDYGYFPKATGGKIDPASNGTGIAWGGDFTDKGYTYMKVMPTEHNAGALPYCYKVSADQKKFGLYSILENTSDKDCQTVAGVGMFTCNTKKYCFAIVSPNATVNPIDPQL